ncbi:AraC family transcriptional regulator [Ulvibacterium sp.]
MVILRRIRYAVGFNRPSYFSKAFKQYFGCSPFEYVENG